MLTASLFIWMFWIQADRYEERTGEELEEIASAIGDVTGEAVIITPDSLKTLDKDDIEVLIEQLELTIE